MNIRLRFYPTAEPPPGNLGTKSPSFNAEYPPRNENPCRLKGSSKRTGQRARRRCSVRRQVARRGSDSGKPRLHRPVASIRCQGLLAAARCSHGARSCLFIDASIFFPLPSARAVTVSLTHLPPPEGGVSRHPPRAPACCASASSACGPVPQRQLHWPLHARRQTVRLSARCQIITITDKCITGSPLILFMPVTPIDFHYRRSLLVYRIPLRKSFIVKHAENLTCFLCRFNIIKQKCSLPTSKEMKIPSK